MSADQRRTICLEDINSMKQQNNWCSWVVKVYAGIDGSTWKSCGVGILTFMLNKETLNTYTELENIIKMKGEKYWNRENEDFFLSVKTQKGLQPPKDKDMASEDIAEKLRGEGDQDTIINCNLSQAENFDWDMNMVIFWTQKDLNLHVSLSFLQGEIFVESWQILCTYLGYSAKRHFNFPAQHNIKEILRILGEDDEKEEKKILLACFVVNSEYVEELIKIYMRFKAKEQKDEKQIQLLRNIQTIMLILIEHDNVDLLMTLIKEKVFIEVLEILEDIDQGNDGNGKFKEFYITRCKRKNLLSIGDNFVDAVETKFRLLYLKDYVFCNTPNESLIPKIEFIETRIDLAIIYNVLSDFDRVWVCLFSNIETRTKEIQQFFIEFFKIYKGIGPIVMSNIASIFVIQEAYTDLIKLQWRLLTSQEKTLSENDLLILYLCYEILGNVCKMTVKGAMQIFGENFTLENSDSKFSFSNVITQSLLHGDQVLIHSVCEMIGKLLEVTTPPAKRVKFVSIINSYVIPELVQITMEKMETIPAHFISSMCTIILGNLLEDKIIELNKDIPEDAKPISTRVILLNNSFLEAVSLLLFKHSVDRGFILNIFKLMSCLLESKDERFIKRLISNKYMDFVWDIMMRTKRRPGLIYSASLSIFSLCTEAKVMPVIDHISKTYEDIIIAEKLEGEKTIRNLMALYRRTRERKESTNFSVSSIDGQFASEPSQNGINSADDSFENPTLHPHLFPRQRFNPSKIVDDENELSRLKHELVKKNSNEEIEISLGKRALETELAD